MRRVKPIRSALFVPGNREDRIQKAPRFGVSISTRCALFWSGPRNADCCFLTPAKRSSDFRVCARCSQSVLMQQWTTWRTCAKKRGNFRNSAVCTTGFICGYWCTFPFRWP